MGSVIISSVTYLTYGSIVGATEYFQADINGATWISAITENQEKALISATRWIDRIGIYDTSGTLYTPVADDTGVPEAVQQASYILAQTLLADATAATKATTGSRVRRVGAGSAQVEFFSPDDGTVFPTVAMQLLEPYLSSASGSTTGGANVVSTESGFVSGTNACTPTGDPISPELHRGWG